MEKNSLLTFFEVLSSKIKCWVLPESMVSRLGFFISNLFYFSPQSQILVLAKEHSLNRVSKSGYEGLFPSIRSVLMFAVVNFFGFTTAFAQTFPPASSCTSGDLLLVGATLPPNAGEDACGSCTAGTAITRTLFLSINNKTGSTRTSFAFWGTLEIINADGSTFSTKPISGCRGPIIKNSINSVNFGALSYPCGKSLRLINLYLAWTAASPGETCPVLTGSPSTINPKCGTLPSIQIVAGLDVDAVPTSATCTAGGSIAVSPFGGKAPYSVTIGGVTHENIAAGATTTFMGLAVATHTITIRDATTPSPCITTKTREVLSTSAPTVGAGTAFMKTCTTNTSGKEIGEVNDTTASYLWSPTVGLSSPTVSNPTANPSTTTTYTLTKTTIVSGCSAQATVKVTVNNTPVTVNAGIDFDKTCAVNQSGGKIGETAVAGFSYAWTSSPVGFNSTLANPSVNPSVTTTYTVTKTNTASSCFNTDVVTVTVDDAAVTANAGNDFTKTCVANTTGGTIGETAVDGFSYAWTSSPEGFNSTLANPSVNPSVTTTYTVTKTNTASSCFSTDVVTVTVDNAVVTANAGSDFTKTCVANTTGGTIGETAVDGFSYAWTSSPVGFNSTLANPSVNPSVTTTYTVTKTNTASSCFNTDVVTVTVDDAAVTANAGTDFTKTCVANTTGGTIGETAVVGFTYSWASSPVGFTSTASNPSVNPTLTTTYTVTKTNTVNGCFNTASVTVTVDNAAVTAGAGSDATINCATPSTTLAATGAGSYSWSPSAGLSATNISNPTATPSVSTTYTVTVTGVNGCIATDDVIVTVDNEKPAPPTCCIIQPSTLCATKDDGSVTILSPIGAEYEYSIKNGADNSWQSGIYFNGLGSGSVTGIIVRNIYTGCISDQAICDASNCTPPPPIVSTEKTINTATKTAVIVPAEKVMLDEPKVGFDAYPVPFKDQLTIKYKFDYVSDVKIEVFNAQGISVLSKMDTNSYLNKEIALDLKLNKGKEQVYIVKVTTDRGSSVKKVMSSR